MITSKFLTFEIRPSDLTGCRTALVLPDIATCPDCLREVSVRTNGNLYRHVARQFSDPRDVIVVQTGTKQVIEIDAADVPAFIAE
jgi:hypothetical protein